MKNKPDGKLVKDVFRAYFDARRNKRNTINQLDFEMDFEHHLFVLASEIQERTYQVGRSICFIVNNPVKREVFAADFRDRVVHHLVFNRLNPFVESKLIRDCYSCRKGKGTGDGIARLDRHIRSVTRNFTEDAYVLKLDIQGYFMSIDRRRLWDIVEKLTREAHDKGMLERYEETAYLLRKIIFNNPTDRCFFKSPRRLWDGLPQSKSLFYSKENCGLPIGNLTSQMFSNVYLCDFDNWVKRDLKMEHYGRYVDDFYVLHKDKQVLIDVKNRITEFLKERYGLVVHPNKIYLQHLNHGVTFLGVHLMPHRRYIRHRSLATIRYHLHLADRSLRDRAENTPDFKELCLHRSRFNSCLGHMAQYKTYKIRKELWEASIGYRKYFYINTSYEKISIKVRYLPFYIASGDENLGRWPFPVGLKNRVYLLTIIAMPTITEVCEVRITVGNLGSIIRL